MRILAIESSSLVAGCAILTDDVITAEYTINYKKTHSQTLLPMIKEIMDMTSTDIMSVDAVAVCSGPGSFTGLRIGAATAKGLCLAADKPLVAIPTMDAMAYDIFRTDALICPIMDARRNQVYNSLYRNNGHFEKLCDDRALDMGELLRELAERKEEVIFLGDGVPAYSWQIEQACKNKYCFAPAHLSRQRAASIAVLAAEYYKNGKTYDADSFAPEYLRKSQAEQEAQNKMQQS